MSNLKIYDDSKNYTCQVIKLPPKIPVKGLDNLVEVNVQGNSCLIGKDSPEDELYLFFPCESQISHEFLRMNNLYRHETLNIDPSQKGFFEDTRRVKAIKFRGIISSGFVLPIKSIGFLNGKYIPSELKVGDEFNEIDGIEICRKYIRKSNIPGQTGFKNPRAKILDNIIDSKLAPEHPDTAHFLKNIHKFNHDTMIAITYKLHGTSARTYNTLVRKKLIWKQKLAKFFRIPIVEEDYEYVAASRRTLKSVGFEELPGKNHYYTSGDLWSEVAKKWLEGKLNKGESVYYEIIGKTYNGEEIQGGYSYGFSEPKIFIYRIANINPDGIEIDLSYDQMQERAIQLGLEVVPEFFRGTLGQFIDKYDNGQTYTDLEDPLKRIFYNQLLEQPSILDNTVVEEGFCIRIDRYPKAETFKIKSKKFLLHEGHQADIGGKDLEEEEQVKIEEDATEHSD